MPGESFGLEFRPATLADAELVAVLDTLADPDEPRDASNIRHWWTMNDANDVTMRRVAMHDGAAVAFLSARHDPWETTAKRFGVIRLNLREDAWTEARFETLVKVAEEWMRQEGVITAVIRQREDFRKELDLLDRLGYRERSRARTSELDLVERRDHIRSTVAACREQMRERGIRLMVLSEDRDPEKMTKLYRMLVEAEKDIPSTTPWRVLNFDAWKRFWFANPSIHQDRYWIARQDESIVGMTALDFPSTRRGVPNTAMTATAPAVRGRGIARALKYEAMNQAIELGFSRVRTNNDADNAPMLRINIEMGYRLVRPTIELHRDLTA
ncbi:MAG TPA: GNAT family N-acetyltransferase [Candidatus Sulfotelmatobacter sp.]|nr:GNAT family N-acetyltransferase [Candidatus Sulfotelmatobacter sp.]